MNTFLRQWKKYFVFAGMLSCLISLLQMTFSFYMFAIYGTIIQSFSRSSLYSITILAVFALIFLTFFSFLRSTLLRTAGLGLEQALSKNVVHFMISGAASPVKQAYRQGLQDVATLRSFLSSDALCAVFDVPWAPFYLVLIFFFHPVLGALALGGALTTLTLTLLQDYWTRKRLVRANVVSMQSRNFIDTMLKNAEVVNAMGMGQAVYDRFEEKNSEILLNQTVASRYAGLSQSSIKAIQVLMNVVIYGGSAFLAITEGFNAGLMIVASILMGQAIGPFMRALFAAKSIVQAREAYKRLHGFSLFLERQAAKMPLPVPQGAITAEHVSFALNGQLVLRNISFALQPGEFLGLIGPNGAGKTTLSKIILGIWPAALGSMRLDGVDVFRWDKAEIGPHLGYLPQEIELFPATVAENIARLGDVDMDEVRRVCDLVGITELIESLPADFETQVGGEGGVMFSGGQKQRIGLARALYGSPAVLLLDEPNSNLDEAGEMQLMQTLARIRQEGRTTCIMITHKTGLLGLVDKILMLQQGQVAQFGDRDDVLAAISRPQHTAQPQSPVLRTA